MSGNGVYPYAAFLEFLLTVKEEHFQFDSPETGPWLWAPASPKFPTMSWHPLPLASIPASRASFKRKLLELFVGNSFRSSSAMASHFTEELISNHAQRRTPSSTPPQVQELSSWILVPEVLGRALCTQIGWTMPALTQPTHPLHHPMPVKQLAVCRSPASMSNRISRGEGPCLRRLRRPRLHLISDLLQLACIILKIHHALPIQLSMDPTFLLKVRGQKRIVLLVVVRQYHGLFARARICFGPAYTNV